MSQLSKTKVKLFKLMRILNTKHIVSLWTKRVYFTIFNILERIVSFKQNSNNQ